MNLRGAALSLILACVGWSGCGGGSSGVDGGVTSDANIGVDAGITRCSPEATPALGRSCDPTVQDCTEGGCYFQAMGCPFQCVRTSGPGIAEAQPCQFLNDCNPGLACLGGVPGCTDMYCCTRYCHLGDTCANGTTCQTAGLDTSPPGLQNVGVCVTN